MKEFETLRLNIKTDIVIRNGLIDFSCLNNSGKIDLINSKPFTGFELGFVCYLKDSSEEVCHVYLTKADNKIEISYGTNEKFRACGFMKEALNAIIGWLKTNTQEKALYARICNNKISEHILISNGFFETEEIYFKEGKLYKFELKKSKFNMRI